MDFGYRRFIDKLQNNPNTVAKLSAVDTRNEQETMLQYFERYEGAIARHNLIHTTNRFFVYF